MGSFSWINKIKTNAASSLGYFTNSLRSNHHYFQRLLTFNSREEAIADPSPHIELQDTAAVDLEAPAVNRVENSTTTATEIEPNTPAAAANRNQDSRTIAELAIPAILSMGVYASVPSDVQLHHHDFPLYYPLLAFMGLGVGASLYIIFYALVKSNGGGQDDAESAKHKWMRISIIFFFIAFILRVLLLQVHWR